MGRSTLCKFNNWEVSKEIIQGEGDLESDRCTSERV